MGCGEWWWPTGFSVSPSPLGTNWVLELFGTWLGFGLGVFGTNGLGTGLDNYFPIIFFHVRKMIFISLERWKLRVSKGSKAHISVWLWQSNYKTINTMISLKEEPGEIEAMRGRDLLDQY